MKVAYFLNTIEFLSIIDPWAEDRKNRGDSVELVIPIPTPEQNLRWASSLARFDRVHTIQLDRSGLGFLSNLKLLMTYLALYREIQPELVLNFTLKPVVFGTFAALIRRSSAKVLNLITGMGYAFTNGPGLRRRLARTAVSLLLYLTTLNRRAVYIVLNSEDRTRLSKIVPALASRLHIIPGTGTPVGDFPLTQEPPPFPVRIAFVGRMLWDKGLGELIEAAKKLKGKGLQFELGLYGGLDPENPAAIPESQILEWQKQGWCSWRGCIHPVQPAYHESHVVVLPSYREGLPRVLVEAGLSGRATIATDVAGCRDVIRNGQTGILVPPKNSDLLADALERLIQDGTLRKQMGLQAQRHCTDSFGVKKVIECVNHLS